MTPAHTHAMTQRHVIYGLHAALCLALREYVLEAFGHAQSFLSFIHPAWV